MPPPHERRQPTTVFSRQTQFRAKKRSDRRLGAGRRRTLSQRNGFLPDEINIEGLLHGGLSVLANQAIGLRIMS